VPFEEWHICGVLPDAAAVSQLATTLEIDQASPAAEGVTEEICHVSATGTCDQIVILGVHVAGTTTVASLIRPEVPPATAEVGL